MVYQPTYINFIQHLGICIEFREPVAGSFPWKCSNEYLHSLAWNDSHPRILVSLYINMNELILPTPLSASSQLDHSKGSDQPRGLWWVIKECAYDSSLDGLKPLWTHPSPVLEDEHRVSSEHSNSGELATLTMTTFNSMGFNNSLFLEHKKNPCWL